MDCCSHEGPAKGDAKFDFKKIADGVHVAVAAPAYKVNCNTAIIESDDGVVIVDTHSKPSAARVIVEGLGDITKKPELARLGGEVPDAVEVGYHLCYGSPADEHLVMPRDMAVMVEMADGLRRALRRHVDFLHMPVPKDRADADYFRPLARLRGFDDSALYLGLIHHDDRAGDLARISAARAFAERFGVAAECGWGRTNPQRVPGLLESHRAAAEHMARAPARDRAGRSLGV